MSCKYSFSGKKVLITGGAQGIGKTIVNKFHDAGATVFTLDKNAETVSKLREELPTVTAETVDLTDWHATKQIIESFGTLDHLVNNAGMIKKQNFMDITKEAASLHFDVNVAAAINVTQCFARGLIEANREGTVVNISSTLARRVSPMGTVMYSATKSALETISKSMALELGAHKIRVNCILPGPVDAPMLYDSGSATDPFVLNTIKERMINKRLVKPEDVAELALFLSSPLSEMIIGDSINIDGGMMVCG